MKESKAFSYINVKPGEEVTEQKVREGYFKAANRSDIQGIKDICDTFPYQVKQSIKESDIPLLPYLLHKAREIILQNETIVLSVVEKLFEWGSDINKPMNNMHTLNNMYTLSLAIEKGLISVAKFLLEKGAVAPYDDENDKVSVVRFFLEKDGIALDDPERMVKLGGMPYFGAAMHYTLKLKNMAIKEKMIKLLLEHGASINEVVKNREIISTPLGIAVCEQNENFVNFLISQGADISAIHAIIDHEAKDSILHYFCINHDVNVEILDQLLSKADLNLNKPNKYGLTPITLVAIRGLEETLEKFLRYQNLLKDDASHIEIGIELVKQCYKNYSILSETVDYLARRIVCHFDSDSSFKYYLYNLHSQGHYDLLDAIFNDHLISRIKEIDESGDVNHLIIEWLERKKWGVTVYFMEKGLFNFLRPISVWIDVKGYDEKKISEFIEPLNESFIHNLVANLHSMLELLLRMIDTKPYVPEVLHAHPLLLSKLTTYVPALNSKLLVDLDLIKKEIEHEKLFKHLKFFTKILDKSIKLKDIKIRHNILGIDVKEKLEEGIKVINEIYSPSCFYQFFTRNERRDFNGFKESHKVNDKTDKKLEVNCIIDNTLNYLNFKDAATFNLILGKNFDKNLKALIIPNQDNTSTNFEFDTDEHDLSCSSPVDNLPRIGEHNES